MVTIYIIIGIILSYLITYFITRRIYISMREEDDQFDGFKKTFYILMLIPGVNILTIIFGSIISLIVDLVENMNDLKNQDKFFKYKKLEGKQKTRLDKIKKITKRKFLNI